MTIQESIRETSWEIRESISRALQEADRTDAELGDERARAARESDEWKAKQEVVTKESQRVGQLEEELAGLQSSLRRLQMQIEDKTSERDSARSSLAEAEEAAAQSRKAQREAENRVEELCRRLAELEREKKELQAELAGSHVESLRRHLGTVQADLFDARRKSSGLLEAKAALDSLRTARHEDVEVAGLCEAREELQRLLKAASVPAVLDALRKEIEVIEAGIERRFPGALQAEGAEGHGPDIIEELFFMFSGEGPPAQGEAQGERARVLVFLPIDGKVWNRLGSDETAEDDSCIVQMVWEIRDQLKVDWKATEIDHDQRLGLTILEAVADQEVGQQTIEYALGGGGSASFVLTPLPAEIVEAIRNHDRGSDATRPLGRHPLQFILRQHGKVSSWSECWPQADEGHAETRRSSVTGATPPAQQLAPPAPPSPPDLEAAPRCGVQRLGAKLIEKMWRKNQWGTRSVSSDTIHAHILPGVKNLNGILEDLVSRGLILKKGRRGPFSLNHKMKGEIDHIAKWSRSHSAVEQN